MHQLLHAAGCPKKTTDLIPDIVETCRACRMWKHPRAKAISTSALHEKFNDTIQVDLMFYNTHIIFNAICCAIRWHVALVIPDKSEETLIEALAVGWFRP